MFPTLRIVLIAALFVLFAAGASNCTAKTYVTCGGFCGGVLPCNQTYDECLSFCEGIESRCDRVGRHAVFIAYVTCNSNSDAGFGCTDAGEPVASVACEPEQSDLVQCQSEQDATLDIPDGAYEADTPCPDAGSCVACCQDHHEAGAKVYAKAVTECVCKPSECQSPCAKEACASRPQTPEANDKCDQCLSTALDDQTSVPGACVVPVTLACNTDVDCALYVNCLMQAGCTN